MKNLRSVLAGVGLALLAGAALATVVQFFADVRSTDEVLEMLAATPR